MRRAHCILALCLSSSFAARADDQQILKDYSDALKTFGAGQAKLGGYWVAAPKQVLDGIDGR